MEIMTSPFSLLLTNHFVAVYDFNITTLVFLE